MGSIWAARLRSMSRFERLFAVKVMLPEFAADATFRTMLLDEGRIAAGILHPNVAQVLDVGQHATGIYLVMEWIDGDTLQRLHNAAARGGKRVPLPVVMRIVADVCAGLHAAHELRDRGGQLLEVVHRDVSPNNIIVTSSGSVKLIDFGIAKARDRAQEETTNGEVKGKLRYMSPEQAQGKSVDRRADIWSLGAVLHFLLTGEPPYARGSEAAALYALVQGVPLKPLPATVPVSVAAIVERALQRDPSARFQTALEMKEALEAAGDELGVRATTASVEAYYAGLMGGYVTARREALEQAIEAVSRRGGGLAFEPSTGSGVRAQSNSSLTLKVVPEVDEPVTTPAHPTTVEVALSSTAAPWVSPPGPVDRTPFNRSEDTASSLRRVQWRWARRWAMLGAAVGLVGMAWLIAPTDRAPPTVPAVPTATVAAAVTEAPPEPPAPAPTLAPSSPPAPDETPAATATTAAAPVTTATPAIRLPRRQRPTVILRRATGAAPELTSIDSRK